MKGLGPITKGMTLAAAVFACALAQASGFSAKDGDARGGKTKLSVEDLRHQSERESAIDAFNEALEKGDVSSADDLFRKHALSPEAGRIEILVTMERGFRGALWLVERGIDPRRVDQTVKPFVLKCDYRSAFRSLLLVRKTSRPVTELQQMLLSKANELEATSRKAYLDAQSNLAIAMKTKNEDVIYEKGTQFYDARYLQHSCLKTRELMRRDLATLSNAEIVEFSRADAERELFVKLYRSKQEAERQLASTRARLDKFEKLDKFTKSIRPEASLEKAWSP